jgi:integrase/recombinase XerD
VSETEQQALAAYVRAGEAAGHTPVTVAQRYRFVRDRLGHGRRDPRRWTREQLEELLSNPAWAANTRVTYFRHATSWFSWLEETERIKRSPMRGMRRPKVPRGTPHPVDTELLGRAIEAATGELRAWLILGAYQGLRVSEIARFRGEQIRGRELRVTGKGGVTAVLPVHPLVAELAQQYPGRGHWFPALQALSARPHRAPSTITTAVGKHLQALGGTGTPHSLRHWFGTEVLEASGGNLRTAQQLLRHASVATTEVYTRVRDANRTAAVLALPDLKAGAR